MTFKKRILMIVMILGLAIISVACSDSENSGSDGNGNRSESGTVTLEFWHTYSDTEEAVFKEKVLPLFEEQHSNIKIKPTRMPNESLKQQVVSAVSGNAAPDLMRMDITWVPEFAKIGALLQVDQLDGFEEVKNSVYESTLSTNQYLGNYYGIPLDTNTKIAIYNKELLDIAGLSDAPQTIDELVEAARTLKEKSGKWGITTGTSIWAIFPYFASLGGTITNEDYTQAEGYLNSEISIQALETIVDWNDEGLIGPIALGGEPGYWDGLKNGEYMMIDDGPWFYSLLMNSEEEMNPMDWTIGSQIPAGEAGSKSIIGGQNLVVFSSTNHPEEAWTFAKWMLTEQAQIIMAEAGMIPTNIEAANSKEVLSVPYLGEYVKQMDNAVARTPVPQWNAMEEIINLNIEKAFRHEMTPEEALNDAAKQVQALLDENK